ncbi:hypothetical protein ACLB2K_047327 [Fragaria x ananassa]
MPAVMVSSFLGLDFRDFVTFFQVIRSGGVENLRMTVLAGGMSSESGDRSILAPTETEAQGLNKEAFDAKICQENFDEGLRSSENVGLLGAGSLLGVVHGNIGDVLQPMVEEKTAPLPHKCKEPYRPPHLFKADGTDYKDEVWEGQKEAFQENQKKTSTGQRSKMELSRIDTLAVEHSYRTANQFKSPATCSGFTNQPAASVDLKDLINLLRRDDLQPGDVLKEVFKWDTVSKDLIPILEQYQEECSLVLNAGKFLDVFTEGDWNLVQLVLTLFLNILAIQDIALQQKSGGTASQFLSCRNSFVSDDILLLLEIFHYTFMGQEPELIAIAYSKGVKVDSKEIDEGRPASCYTLLKPQNRQVYKLGEDKSEKEKGVIFEPKLMISALNFLLKEPGLIFDNDTLVFEKKKVASEELQYIQKQTEEPPEDHPRFLNFHGLKLQYNSEDVWIYMSFSLPEAIEEIGFLEAEEV